jgi:DNA-binding LacI/PurR family transcriptional regulator/DNA-binding transcriptional regulator YhcF (GntR family)
MPTGKAKQPAILRAQAWILERINARAWFPANTLPSLDSLATSAGVSRHTMWQATKALSYKGIIRTGRGHQSSLNGTPSLSGRTVLTWEEIALQVTRALVRGDYAPGAILPPTSKLGVEWHVNFRTVKKALDSLASQRIVDRIGCRYVAPSLAGRTGRLTILFINEGIANSNLAQVAMMQRAERHAQKSGLAINLFEQSFSSPCNAIGLRKLVIHESISGILIDFWGLGAPKRVAHFNALLSILYSFKIPVSIIDEDGSLALDEPFRSSERIRIFSLAAHTAGKDIGRYLIQAGHRKAAFLTTAGNQAWSLKRCEGLSTAFIEAGLGRNQVAVFQTPWLPDIVPLVCAAAHCSPQELADSFFVNSADLNLANAHRQVAHIRPLLAIKKESEKQLKRQIRSLLKAGRVCKDRISFANYQRLLDNLGAPLYRRFLSPVFSKALGNPDITVWVAATDSIALQALSFLKQRKIPVPSKIAVIGFDNSFESAGANLSTYDFDQQRLVHSAFSFACGRPETKKQEPGTIECPGVIIERGTTGR